MQVATAELAIAEVVTKRVEVAFESGRLEEQINEFNAAARQPEDDTILAAKRRVGILAQGTGADSKCPRRRAGAHKAQRSQATAKVAFHTKQFNRIRMLHEQHAVEKRVVEETEDQLRAAEADQHSAQATVSVAQSRLTAAEENLKARKDP